MALLEGIEQGERRADESDRHPDDHHHGDHGGVGRGLVGNAGMGAEQVRVLRDAPADDHGGDRQPGYESPFSSSQPPGSG
ncbi:hypothetical protein ACIA5C_37580 [Actinoplanes sp. NPDC051343]|uniref:hypothetical protein n=1 Tax=Actinoplanes sp. NPDC051343 TaxID=3363906 RepID=UPI0037A0C19D